MIIGERSFGKGLVQGIFPLPNSGALILTIAHYYTPSGRSIQSKGITPDLEIDADTPTDAGNTALLDEAVRQLKNYRRA